MRSFLKGFACAAFGIATAIKEERNMRFHLCAACYVLLFSLFYHLSAAEYCILFFVISLVLSCELVNSAIERIVDGLSPEWNKTAGLAKDIAAGAVLVTCIGAAACGFLLFWNTAVFKMICRFFLSTPILLVLLVLSLAASLGFVFCFDKFFRPKRKKGE